MPSCNNKLYKSGKRDTRGVNFPVDLSLLLGQNITMVCPKKILPVIILASLIIFAPDIILAAKVSTTPAEPAAKSEVKQETATTSGTMPLVPTPTINFQTVGAANTLYNRLQAATSRLELVFNRITARVEKVYAAFSRGKADPKAKQLNSQYTSLKTQVDKLKVESSKTQELYKSFLTEPNNTNYQALRKQVVTTDSLLKQVLEAEKTVLVTAKGITPVSASASATLKVTKAVSPTPVRK